MVQIGKLKDEREELTTEIADLKQLLDSKQKVLQVISKVCFILFSGIRDIALLCAENLLRMYAVG